MIIYRVDVYRSRPICASLLTPSPQQGCLALNGLYTGWLGVVTGIRLIQISTGGFLVTDEKINGVQSLTGHVYILAAAVTDDIVSFTLGQTL